MNNRQKMINWIMNVKKLMDFYAVFVACSYDINETYRKFKNKKQHIIDYVKYVKKIKSEMKTSIEKLLYYGILVDVETFCKKYDHGILRSDDRFFDEKYYWQLYALIILKAKDVGYTYLDIDETGKMQFALEKDIIRI